MGSKYQSFDDPAFSSQGSPSARERLAALRKQLVELDLAGFIIPRSDEHQGEYAPLSEERLAWLTGFSGSAGTALVTADNAAVIIDGRYVIQAREQLDTSLFSPLSLCQTTPEQWIAKYLPPNGMFGYDPWLHTSKQVQQLQEAVEEVGGTLVPVSHNPIDEIWHERPASPQAPIRLHPLSVAGETVASKLSRLRQSLSEKKVDALIISDPHNIAWLFNIRGSDVPHTPIALGYAFVPLEGRPTLLFADNRFEEITANAVKQFADIGFSGTKESVSSRHGLARIIADFSANSPEQARILIDSATGAFALQNIVTTSAATFIVSPDPITMLKACKNIREIEGARAAHRRDGVAMTRFLAWLAEKAPSGSLTEIEVAETLENFRQETGLLVDISFDTIAGSNENAALPHYRVTHASNRPVTPGILLVDSGGQYIDGTTDITRTVAVGTPSPEMRDHFTRVLKGHIAISTSVFPKGTTGAQLDPFARRSLWEVGLDFDHGTGHGVGSFLSVHEGPQRISKLGGIALEVGMILSNEPGYYREGHYGIRIENLMVVEERQILGSDKIVLGFETLTLAPIDRSLIAIELLNMEERSWLNAYHARVYNALSSQLDDNTRAWLQAATAAI